MQWLKNDFRTVIYKQSRNEWRNADIIVSTVQSFSNIYKDFSPTDFDLIVADECHRAIGGNSRAVLNILSVINSD